MADRHLIDVHVLLTDGDRLLLTQRRGNDAFAGRWHLPSGKLDADEPITAAAAREACEEVTGLRETSLSQKYPGGTAYS
ncbi:NUDIX domain-containing protein [Nocardia pseudovaccinii]|uniref:NUDIX domain-containing protein n=1 Tax=Nocardia pseudovaccinii TaxID=189540 RepID=UPI000A063BD5|nr:NUDIX domain-containing protein [Nocardia pseudovaccinii]